MLIDSPPMDQGPGEKRKIWGVIGASSVGTLIEWYDFYIFGSLATVIAGAFFPKGNETVALLSTLATFATGFLVRPFGAVVFGRIGDLVGRKYAFMVTLLIMGGATFAIGLLPTYEQAGILGPILLVLLRLLQGLALGGEYGGAATYVAEHSPDAKRGFYTSWIQTTATLGLAVSLGVILACRGIIGPDEFARWGWRVPFLLSVVLVGVSVYIRLKLQESPLFSKMKREGKASASPLRDSFGNWVNLRMVLLALFGATAGQGVVWYTGQFYALLFLQKTLLVEFVQSNWIVGAALIAGTPFFVVFGAMSDRVGRKPIILSGCLIAALAYVPIYRAMSSICDVGAKTRIETSSASRESLDGAGVLVRRTTETERFSDGSARITTRTKGAGDEVAAVTLTPSARQAVLLSCLVFIQVIFVTMVYGPIAAFLVELFPTRIRYTSMSLPYHIGNGVFGGLVPFIATGLSAWMIKRGVGGEWARYAGLVYPIFIALVTVAVGVLLIRERRGVILDDVE